MLKKHLNKKSALAVALLSAVSYSSVSSAAISYSENFEGYTTGDISGFVIGNIVNGGAGWFPGTFGAPGDYNNGYSAIINEGGAAQGNNQMSVFSDYNPWSPFTGGPGTTIQAFVYHDLATTFDVSDIGKTYNFTFDAKLGNIEAPSQAEAFVKVLDSIGGSYNELANLTFDSDANLTTDWGAGSISITVDAGMVGQLVQIGFNNTATDWGPSGVVYDNLNFAEATVVPVPAAAWLFGTGLLGLIGVARRKA